MNTSFVHETIVDGQTIAPIIAELEAAIGAHPRDHVIIALISMAVIVTYPEISPENLQRAVGDVSRHICLVLDAPVDANIDAKLLMN